MELQDLDKMPEKISDASKKGFWYYFSYIFIILSAVVAAYFVGACFETIPSDPTKTVIGNIFQNNGIIASLAIFVVIFGSYVSGQYISKKRQESVNSKSESDKVDVLNSASAKIEIAADIFKNSANEIKVSIDDFKDSLTEKLDDLEGSLVKKIVEHEDEKRENAVKKHDELMMYRFNYVNEKISEILKDLLISLRASKACVFEMHNGTNNVTGLPFLYADMNYEETSDDKYNTADEFKNINLARYTFISKHIKEGNWCGSTDQLRKEDSKLAAKLDVIDIKYAAMMVLHGQDRPIGFLQIYFSDTDEYPSNKEILSIANTAAQKISALLNANCIEKMI